MNWDHAQFFLAVARMGTLRAAARVLGVDQATVGRRVSALESELSSRLFLRTPSMFLLTEAGETLVKPAEAMERAAHAMAMHAAGRDQQLAGTVRIATTESLASQFVLPALLRLRALHPGIEVICLTSSRVANMNRREADLAIRTVRPDSPDLIARRLGRYERGIYASKQYVKARGRPESGRAFAGHDLIVYQRAIEPLMWETLCGEPIVNGHIVFQASSTPLFYEAALTGLGITALSTFRAAGEKRLVRLLPERSERYEVWLVMHADLNRTARVQAVVQQIADEFERVRTDASLVSMDASAR